MRSREDKNWELIGDVLAAESSGKSPRLFSSRRTLFGIPSALDQELEALSNRAAEEAAVAKGLQPAGMGAPGAVPEAS